MSKKRVGFVASGGAVKAAAFHVGVCMALENRGFEFSGGLAAQPAPVKSPRLGPTVDVYVGSSAGCLVTTYLAQGHRLSDVLAQFQRTPADSSVPGLKYWEMLSPRWQGAREWLSPESLIEKLIGKKSVATFKAPFTTDGIAEYLRRHVIRSEKFSDLKADLLVTATELNQSKKAVFGRFKSVSTDPYLEYRNDVSVSDACAASMALPPVYHPYPIQVDGRRVEYFDGEIREPLSTHVARDVGCDLIVVSYTHQPMRLMPGQKSLSDRGIQDVVLQALYQSIEQKIQSARDSRSRERALLDRVRKFCLENEINKSASEELLTELESRMTYKRDVDYLYIHPRPSDYEMFSGAHFSLQKGTTERIVRRGYVAAMSALRGLRFKDQPAQDAQ